jgi:hypothetical protein
LVLGDYKMSEIRTSSYVWPQIHMRTLLIGLLTCMNLQATFDYMGQQGKYIIVCLYYLLNFKPIKTSSKYYLLKVLTYSKVPNTRVGGKLFERKCRRDFFCLLGEKKFRWEKLP